MKKSVLFTFFILYTCNLFAQTIAANVPAPPINTILPNTTKSTPVQSPAKKSAILSTNTIADNIAQMTMLSKFFNALQIAGLTETFKSAGPITLFIPDDQAFEKMPHGKLDTLLRPDHKPELIAFITYHAIAGKISARNISRQIVTHKNLATFTTLSGGKLIAKFDEGHHIILIDETGGQSTINQSNMEQSNGMLFVIDTVLIPKNRLL